MRVMTRVRGGILLLAAAVIMAGCHKDTSNPVQSAGSVDLQDQWLPDGTPIEGHYIVVLKQTLSKGNAHEAILAVAQSYGLAPDQVYENTIHGFAAQVSPDRLSQLKSDPRVAYIEQDRVVSLPPFTVEQVDLSKTNGQTTPWGITRVGGGVKYTGTATAWVIDTGIDFTHPDLTVDASRSKNFVKANRPAVDDNGHGSHVSGIIAAKDNAEGVIGVAAGATLVAVKVLNASGSGSWSQVIAGVNYVGANGKSGDVANMSLGGGVSQSVDDAVTNASKNGIRFTIAAGNSSASAGNSSPARVNGTNIYTISAFGQGDVFASFSNYGNPPIDYSEPGVSIYSTYRRGGYATMSGTSMAAPHAAGILLLGTIRNGGTVSGDPDKNPDTIGIH